MSYVVTTPGYFETMSIPVLAGRTLRHTDDGTERVAIINRTAAETFFPDRDPIGEMVLGRPDNPDTVWARIIGVVDDVRQDIREAPLPEVYVPPAQDRILGYSLVVKTTGPASASTAAVRDTLAEIDPDIPVTRVRSLEDHFRTRTSDDRFNAGRMSTSALIALGLAAVGRGDPLTLALVAAAVAVVTVFAAAAPAWRAASTDPLTVLRSD